MLQCDAKINITFLKFRSNCVADRKKRQKLTKKRERQNKTNEQ